MWKRLWMMLPMAALLVLPATSFGDLRDDAGMFSRDAVTRAKDAISKIEATYQVPVRVVTINTRGGLPPADLAKDRFRELGGRGFMVLFVKQDRDILFRGDASLASRFTRERQDSLRAAFAEQFKKGEFDAGLLKGLDSIKTILAATPVSGTLPLAAEREPVKGQAGQAAPPPARAPAKAGQAQAAPPVKAQAQQPWGLGTWIILGVGIFAALIVFKLIGNALGGGGNRGYAGQPAMGMNRPMPGAGPGYGPAPGYGGGGGGGGFMTGMLGGLGGALAGNWLYNQFSGHHNQPVGGPTSSAGMVDPVTGGSTADPGADASFGSEGAWGNDAGGGNWDAGGGGDWGGGGGGDWGGGDGGGGGDW